MTAVYLESSALLSWLLGEPNSGRCLKILNQADTVLTSVLTVVEFKRALIRGVTAGELTEKEERRLLGLMEAASLTWAILEITASVRERAGVAFPVEPVRSLDAIHLASILEFIPLFPELTVLSLDRRILDNLEPLGIAAS